MPFRIELCGAMGAGKTSLARVLHNAFPTDLQLVQDNYRETLFWEECWSNGGNFEFERDVSFLLHHRYLLAKTSSNSVCDFSFLDDLAFSRLLLKPTDQSLFQAIYDRVETQMPKPALLLYLACSVQTLFQRVHSRGRSEEVSVSMNFLQDLVSSTESVIAEFRAKHREIPILTIDTDALDFVQDASCKASICARLEPMMEQLRK